MTARGVQGYIGDSASAAAELSSASRGGGSRVDSDQYEGWNPSTSIRGEIQDLISLSYTSAD